MFFARLAKSIRNPAIQHDLTKHFADESQHAWYWSECLADLAPKPMRVADAYQSQYFDAIGAPVNLMEVLAITQVFEKRTINHYSRHSKLAMCRRPCKKPSQRSWETKVGICNGYRPP